MENYGKEEYALTQGQDPGPVPTAAGCYIAMPAGCPKDRKHPSANSGKWFDPTAGGSSRDACKRRRDDHIKYCDTSNALMVYNLDPGP